MGNEKEQSTEVALRQATREQLEASKVYQQSIAIREAAKVVAKQQWGLGLTPAERHAVAMYAVELDVDPTKLRMFGGNLYLEAEGYFDKFHAYYPEGAEEQENVSGNPAAREEWGAPACAVAVIVTRLWKQAARRDAGLKPDVVECNWAPKTDARSKKAPYALLDSVGVENPHKTARTRSARRAMRKITPLWSQRAEAIERRILLLHEQAKLERRQVEVPQLYPTTPDDPYADSPGTGVGTAEVQVQQGNGVPVELLSEINKLAQHAAFTEEERESIADLIAGPEFDEHAARKLLAGMQDNIEAAE